jgi:hypothetical protein
MERASAIHFEDYATSTTRGYECTTREVNTARHFGGGRTMGPTATVPPRPERGHGDSPNDGEGGGFFCATEAPVREPPRPRTTANMFMKHGVVLPQPQDARSVFHAVPMAERGLAAEDAVGSYVAARRQCLELLDEIVVAVHEHRARTGDATAKFLDVDFLLGAKESLYPSGTASDSRVGAPADVARLSSLFAGLPVVAKDSPAEVEPDATDLRSFDLTSRDFDELRQGHLGDAHLIAAMHALLSSARGRGLLERLVVLPRSLEAAAVALEVGPTPIEVQSSGASDNYLDVGAVGILLFVDGRWEWIVIDDTVALDASNSLLYISARPPLPSKSVPFFRHSTKAFTGDASGGHQASPARGTARGRPSELWPMLLEKAFAKAHGCYDGIDGGLPREALASLTGGSEFVFRLHEADDMKPCAISRQTSHLPAVVGRDDEPANATRAPTGNAGSSSRFRSALLTGRKSSSMGHAAGALPRAAFAAGYQDFQTTVLDSVQTSVFCVARARSRTSRTTKLEDAAAEEAKVARRQAQLRVNGLFGVADIEAEHRADDVALALLQADALYPLVQCWRSEADGEARVVIYDAWSTPEAVERFNIARAYAERESQLSQLVADAQRGLLDESVPLQLARTPVEVRQGSAARFVTLRWSDFVAKFDSVEGIHVLKDTVLPATRLARCLAASEPFASSYHTVQAFADAQPTLRMANADGDLVQDPMPHFVLHLDAPVRGIVDFSLLQQDPKTHVAGGATHYSRKHQPYALLAFDVYEFGTSDPNEMLKRHLVSTTALGVQSAIDAVTKRAREVVRTPARYRRQVCATAELERGYYLIVPRVMKAPATAFVVSVTAMASAVLTLTRLAAPDVLETSVAEHTAPAPVSELLTVASKGRPVADKRGRIVDDARESAFLNATMRILDRVAPNDQDEAAAEPLSYRRARELRGSGAAVPVGSLATSDGHGGVTTRRLPRPSSVELGYVVSPRMSSAAPALLALEAHSGTSHAARTPEAISDSAAPTRGGDATTARAALQLMVPNADGSDSVRAGCVDSFSVADVLGSGGSRNNVM